MPSYSPPRPELTLRATPLAAPAPQVIGTALALLLLTGGALPLWGGVLLAAAGAYTMLFLERLGARWLEALFQALVAGREGSGAPGCFRRLLQARRLGRKVMLGQRFACSMGWGGGSLWTQSAPV